MRQRVEPRVGKLGPKLGRFLEPPLVSDVVVAGETPASTAR